MEVVISYATYELFKERRHTTDHVKGMSYFKKPLIEIIY